MQNIKLRFVTCGDLVSALIRDKTFCAYSHVEFVLNDGTTLGAHAEGGVAIRPANYDNFTKIAVFNVPVATDEVKASILAFAMAQVGKPYDFGAIAGLVLNRDWRNTSKWFCSELVAAAFEQGQPLLRVADSVDRITPRDVLLSLCLVEA
jgi:uncharacterized protein YycO